MLSTVAHGDIKSVDTTEALAMPGVKGYISSADVPGNNEWDGELVFNDKTVGVCFHFQLLLSIFLTFRYLEASTSFGLLIKCLAPKYFYFCEGLKNDGCSGLVVQHLPFLQTQNTNAFGFPTVFCSKCKMTLVFASRDRLS